MVIAVVKIEFSYGKTKKYGTGFYISRNYILTACHNVSQKDVLCSNTKPNVKIISYLSDGNIAYKNINVIWYNNDEFIDCAILYDPLSVTTSFFTEYRPHKEKEKVVVIGYTNQSYDTRYGVIDGDSQCLENKDLTKVRITNIDIKHGMSGAPVMDEDQNYIFGHIVQRDRENLREAYFIPLITLLKLTELNSFFVFFHSVQSFHPSISRICTIAHFLDHYVIAVNSQYAQERLIKEEIDRAFLYLFAISDVIYVPAVSYFEMIYCRQLINTFAEAFPDGKIVLIGDGDDIYSFLNIRMSEYPKETSRQHIIYRNAIREIANFPPYKAIESNTTKSLINQWPKIFINEEGYVSEKFFTNHLVKKWEHNLINIEEMLDGNAFITKNVCRLFYSRANLKSQYSVMESINSVFFDNFVSILNCYYLSNLYYLKIGGPTLSKLMLDYEKVSIPFIRNNFYDLWSKDKTYHNFSRLIKLKNIRLAIENFRKIL